MERKEDLSHTFHRRCKNLNSNQSKECGYVMKFPLSHFNVLILGISGYDCKLLIMRVCIRTGVGYIRICFLIKNSKCIYVDTPLARIYYIYSGNTYTYSRGRSTDPDSRHGIARGPGTEAEDNRFRLRFSGKCWV